jgi:hypothetical protein
MKKGPDITIRPFFSRHRGTGFSREGCISNHTIAVHASPSSRLKPVPRHWPECRGSDHCLDGDFRLFVSVVRGTDQRPGRHVFEAHLVTFFSEPGEDVRVHEALHRQVVA